jgi:hypothetical protein
MSYQELIIEYFVGWVQIGIFGLFVAFWVCSSKEAIVRKLLFLKILYLGCLVSLAAEVLFFLAVLVLTRGRFYITFVPFEGISPLVYETFTCYLPLCVRMIGHVLIVIGACLGAVRQSSLGK